VLTRKPSGLDIPVMPTAEGDLRETFDLSMMTDAAKPSKGVSAGGTAGVEAADALALFEDKPTAPRRKKAGDARAEARRCPTCGGFVPKGMSICQTCGLDLESGTRVDLADDLMAPSAPRATGIPLPVGIVGGLCAATSTVLAIVALAFWAQGKNGAQYFIPIAGFGIYASVQFLRLKSVKLLLVALTLGAVIDLAAFVALPIYQAQTETILIQNAEASSEDPDVAEQRIRSVEEQLDMGMLKTGFTLLGGYAGLSIFLISPLIQRHFRK